MRDSKKRRNNARPTRRQINESIAEAARTGKLPRSTPAMWVLYACYLLILCGVSAWLTVSLMDAETRTLLPTYVYTIGADTFSMKVPDGWTRVSGTTGDIGFEADTDLEAFTVSFDEYATVDEAVEGLGAELMEKAKSYNSTISRNANGTACLFRTEINGGLYIYGAVCDGGRLITYRYEASSELRIERDLSAVVESLHLRQNAS